MFSEELANSCGLGIHTTATKSATSKESIPKLPLDSYKVAACKGMMSKLGIMKFQTLITQTFDLENSDSENSDPENLDPKKLRPSK